VKKSEGKRIFRRSSRRWEENIKLQMQGNYWLKIS